MHLDCETLYVLEWCIYEEKKRDREMTKDNTNANTKERRKKIIGKEANFCKNLTAESAQQNKHVALFYPSV